MSYHWLMSGSEVEIWKDIKGFEGFYQVSNLGRVKSLDRAIIRSDGTLARYSGRILQTRAKLHEEFARDE